MRKLRKGQSTLEYVIILAAVVGGIIAIALALKGKMTDSYGTLGNTMGNKVTAVTF
jgi:Flp pilus assembly pilin Flp